MAEQSTRPGVRADLTSALAGFTSDFHRCWKQLPNKAFFFALLAAWFLLFQFLGNATFGYIDSSSLFTWMYVAYTGNDWEEGHGLLIPFVVIALFWWKRDRLLGLKNGAWWPGLFLLAAAVALHVLGYLVQQPRLSIVALYAGIYALMGVAWGPGWLRASIFPMFLFLLCVPFATLGAPVTTITFFLRILVAKIVTAISGTVLGLDIVREGTQLYNASHTFGYDVAAACSGLRSSFSILALSTIFGFVTFEKNWKRLVMIASAVPLAVLGNTIRMMCIIIAAEYGGQPDGDFVHENFFFSIVPYIPAFLGLMLLAHWLREREGPAAAAVSARPKPI